MKDSHTKPKTDFPLIARFCEELCKNYRIPQIVSPDTIAKEFSEYFRLCVPPTLTTNDLLSLCKEIGLGLPREMTLPEKIRGFHVETELGFEISYKEGEWDGGIRHTVLHEIYEILIHILDEEVPSNLVTGKVKESNAHQFAATVLMPRDNFLDHCIRFSFDPLSLQDKYNQSYHSIVLRMRDVLKGQTSFVGLIYENPNRWGNELILQHVCKTKDIAHSAQIKIPVSGESCYSDNHFHELVRRSLELHGAVTELRIPFLKGGDDKKPYLICGCYPVCGKEPNVYRVIVTGIHENDWEKLREKKISIRVFPSTLCVPES